MNIISGIPMGNTPLDVISATDVGPVVCELFKNPPAALHKTFSLSGCKVTIADMVSIWRKYVPDKSFKDKQVCIRGLIEYSFHLRVFARNFRQDSSPSCKVPACNTQSGCKYVKLSYIYFLTSISIK